MAAYGAHGIASIYPPLIPHLKSPETSTLPSMIAVTQAWREEVLLTPRTLTLARAAAARTLDPSSGERLEEAPSSSRSPLATQEIEYEIRWKAEFVEGQTLSDDRKTICLNQNLIDKSDSSIADLIRLGTWSDFDQNRYERPEAYPSILSTWYDQGGRQFQKIFTRARDTSRFLYFLDTIPDLERQAVFRGMVNPIASMPLRTLPNKPERTYASAEF